MEKSERTKLLFDRLGQAPMCSSEQEALQQLSDILNEIEDEFTLIPFNPENWQDDGRLYPPQADARRIENADVSRYRSRDHNTFIGSNGAIKIKKGDETWLDKAGTNGLTISDLLSVK